MTDFQLFTPLFAKIDAASNGFIHGISSNAITAITPIVSVALVLSFTVFGLLIIMGKVEMPMLEFLWKSVTVLIITSFAMAGGIYQREIAGMITVLPDRFAQLLITSPTTGATAAGLIDQAAGEGFSRAGEAFERAGVFSGQSFALIGILILAITAILTAIGGAFLLTAKLALDILAGLGPLFIFALLFTPTRRFFDVWLHQIFNFTLIIILFAAVFSLVMTIFGNYMQDLRLDGTQNVAYALGGATVLAVGSLVILLQLPSIAAGLAGGAALGHLAQMRAMRESVGHRAIRGGDGRVSRPGTGAIGITGSAVRGARAIAGYARR